MGGDEFAVILSEISSAEDAQAVAAKLLEELGRPMALLGRRCRVGASVYPDDGTDVDALIRMAGALMYRAKKRRKTRCMKPVTTSINAPDPLHKEPDAPALQPEPIQS